MHKYLLTVLLLFALHTNAQQSKDVSEDSSYEAGGLKFGYNILNESVKEVGDKGNFSRYEISFYVTNTGGTAKLILFSAGTFKSDDDYNMQQVAHFDCLNATGARLTSKSATINAKALYVTAREERKNCDGKYVTERNKVQIGYYIGAGQTALSKEIIIVPLNEKPKIKVRVLANFSEL
jgi:hypothetical protein